MIALTCTSCKKVLQIDDAFAGGVCRCQHCGTIQTVPSSLKNQPNAAGTGAKTLYQRKTPTPGSSGGSAVAAVTDAPPTTGSARVRAAAPQNPDVAAPKLPLVPLLISGVVLVIVVVAFIFWLTR
jgi:hypothetical protein